MRTRYLFSTCLLTALLVSGFALPFQAEAWNGDYHYGYRHPRLNFFLFDSAIQFTRLWVITIILIIAPTTATIPIGTHTDTSIPGATLIPIPMGAFIGTDTEAYPAV